MPDKGQGVAILDKLDYIAKMGKILSDKTAFMQVNKNVFLVLSIEYLKVKTTKVQRSSF